jgi:hypothetical protein
VAHRACVFQTIIFRSCEHALRLPRKSRALSNWKTSSRPPNVRAGASAARGVDGFGELRLRKPELPPDVRISNSGASDWVGGANSGSSATMRSMSASVRLSNFSASKSPFCAFACCSVLRVIIKTSHSTGRVSPK